jgi:hypothetical protein
MTNEPCSLTCKTYDNLIRRRPSNVSERKTSRTQESIALQRRSHSCVHSTILHQPRCVGVLCWHSRGIARFRGFGEFTPATRTRILCGPGWPKWFSRACDMVRNPAPNYFGRHSFGQNSRLHDGPPLSVRRRTSWASTWRTGRSLQVTFMHCNCPCTFPPFLHGTWFVIMQPGTSYTLGSSSFD